MELFKISAMTKEKILNNIIPDASDNFDANYREEVLQSMDEYAKEVAIGFNIWKSEKGYYAQGITRHTTNDAPVWIRQENQLCFSKPISTNNLYDLYLEHLKQQNNG